MKKKKISELIGAELDWAVATACGVEYRPDTEYDGIGFECPAHAFSTDWSQGGPIIEQGRIAIRTYTTEGAGWFAHSNNGFCSGPTALIAAMRSFVATKLGGEVEIPSDLDKKQ